ncbi:hypothetical protein BpHYR1_023993 [Brachionus plicatilis]|uniref:Uncharacterized protein n=1 Tax=Brachionus plicatilis TaxID=10195 RepID=A0A3M7SI10_BRAPC|nr:hypothetical protein BpHYR1_023993 [Brachionus plicatilis]
MIELKSTSQPQINLIYIKTSRSRPEKNNQSTKIPIMLLRYRPRFIGTKTACKFFHFRFLIDYENTY